MRIINQQAARASRPPIVTATCWLAASIAIMAFSERVYAAPHVGDTVAFAPPVTAPDAEDIRLLAYRQDPLDRPLDLDVVRQPSDSLGIETGMASFRDRRDLNILAVSTDSRRMRPRRPKASHSRFRHTSKTAVQAVG
jgi:hypothetical protein